jgi:hypothetical protein
MLQFKLDSWVAVPALVGIRLDVALPPLAVTGDAGLKEPVTPLRAKVPYSRQR